MPGSPISAETGSLTRCVSLGGERGRALGEAEGDQQAAVRGADGGRARAAPATRGCRPHPCAGAEALGEPQGRRVAGVAPEQQRRQQRQQGHNRDQELAHRRNTLPG